MINPAPTNRIHRFLTGDLRSAHSLLALGATETYLGNFNIGPVDPQMKGKDETNFSLSDLKASYEYLNQIGQEGSIPTFLEKFFSTFHPVSFARLCRTHRYLSSFIMSLLEGRVDRPEEALNILLGGDRPHGVAIETPECLSLMSFFRGTVPSDLACLLEELQSYDTLGIASMTGATPWS
jgi:hypothetical protein